MRHLPGLLEGLLRPGVELGVAFLKHFEQSFGFLDMNTSETGIVSCNIGSLGDNIGEFDSFGFGSGLSQMLTILDLTLSPIAILGPGNIRQVFNQDGASDPNSAWISASVTSVSSTTS